MPDSLCYTAHTSCDNGNFTGFELEATMQQPLTSVQLSATRPPEAPQLPPRPRSIEETGLSLSYIADLMLRALYLIGEMSGQQLVDLLHLPYDNVIDQGIAYLRREQMCEI